MKSLWKPAAMGLVLAVASFNSATANILPFTWNPAGASPQLAGPGSAFTADTMYLNDYLRGVTQSDDSFVGHRFSIVTGFSLLGSQVLAPGFGSSYGLYFEWFDRGTSFPPPDILHATSVDMVLRADPGNQNGTMSSSPDAIGFANTGPTGTADDIVLATGSMITAKLHLDVTTGILVGDFLLTFDPAADQSGFFEGGSGSVRFFASNPATLVMTPGPDGSTIVSHDIHIATVQFVPEPASMLLLGTGLIGLLLLRHVAL